MFTRQPWLHTLTLTDVFHNDDLTLEEKRDAIVRRIKAAPWYSEDDDDLYWLVDELADVDTDSYFDAVFNAFYDWADDHRVWVETV
jgi:hypothetical protein